MHFTFIHLWEYDVILYEPQTQKSSSVCFDVSNDNI